MSPLFAETFGPEHRPIVEFAVDNVQTLKQRKAKLQAQWQNDESNTLDTNPTKQEQSKKWKPSGVNGAGKDSGHDEDIKEDTGVPKQNTTEKRRANKKQKRNPANEMPLVSLKENIEGKIKGPKRNRKDHQDGRKPDGEATANNACKSNSSEKPDFRPQKRKLEDQTEVQTGEKSMKRKRPRKNNDSSGREVVDKLDMLIEQYRNKFSQQSSNNTDVDKKGSKQLRRWFQS